MDALRKQVAQAQRRLILGQFLAKLAWCWFATLIVAAVAIGVAKVLPLDLDSRTWWSSWFGGALALGLLVAAVWTWSTRRGSLAAALEVDRRFGLKERISSTLAMDPAELETAAGQALVADALRHVERIDVGSRFRVAMSRRNLLPLLPAMLAFGLAFVADREGELTADAKLNQVAAVEQVKTSAEALRRKLAEKQKEAEEQGLKDAADLFKQIEQGTKDLTKLKDVNQKQGLVKLNDLAKQLEARRKELGTDDKIKHELSQMKDFKNGPGDKLAKAMANGDFQKALDEVARLRDELDKGGLDEEKRKEVAEQLAQIEKSLGKMADQHQQAREKLEQQITEMKKAGQTAEAQQLQKQLDKLQEQAPQMDQLRQLAQKCGKCANSLKQGQSGQAHQSLDQLTSQLQSLKHQSDELEMLDEAMDQISDAKSSMTCKKCGGKGCEECQGQGSMAEQGPEGKKGGNGLGPGDRGYGPRPEKETQTKFYDTKDQQKYGKGAAMVVGETNGPNSRGQIRSDIKNEIESAKHEAADPLTGQRLPRSEREHAKEYFDSLREGN